MADVTQRALALLAELQTGRPFAGDDLATRLGVSPRTLRRDVDRLRGYGYPVETQPGPGGFYRLAAGRAMPPLLLEDDEAIATLLGLAILGSASGPEPTPDASDRYSRPTTTIDTTAANPHPPTSPDAAAANPHPTTPPDAAAANPHPTTPPDAAAANPHSTTTPDNSAHAPDHPGTPRTNAYGPTRTGTTGTTIEDAAARAYGKVDQYLPTRLRPRAAALRASLETAPTLAPSTSSATITTLATAIHHRQLVTFAYRDSPRRVEPYRQIHRGLRWYLLAWDTDRHDWRVFRTDRIAHPAPLDATFVPRPLPADSATAFLRQGLNKHRDRVVVTVEASPGEVADALRHHDVELTPAPEGRTRAVVMLDSWQWLVLSLAFLDADFTIHEPATVREACHRFADRLRR